MPSRAFQIFEDYLLKYEVLYLDTLQFAREIDYRREKEGFKRHLHQMRHLTLLKSVCE